MKGWPSCRRRCRVSCLGRWSGVSGLSADSQAVEREVKWGCLSLPLCAPSVAEAKRDACEGGLKGPRWQPAALYLDNCQGPEGCGVCALCCTDLPAKLSETCRRLSSQTGSSRGRWPGLVYAVIRCGMSQPRPLTSRLVSLLFESYVASLYGLTTYSTPLAFSWQLSRRTSPSSTSGEPEPQS